MAGLFALPRCPVLLQSARYPGPKLSPFLPPACSLQPAGPPTTAPAALRSCARSCCRTPRTASSCCMPWRASVCNHTSRHTCCSAGTQWRANCRAAMQWLLARSLLRQLLPSHQRQPPSQWQLLSQCRVCSGSRRTAQRRVCPARRTAQRRRRRQPTPWQCRGWSRQKWPSLHPAAAQQSTVCGLLGLMAVPAVWCRSHGCGGGLRRSLRLRTPLRCMI